MPADFLSAKTLEMLGIDLTIDETDAVFLHVFNQSDEPIF